MRRLVTTVAILLALVTSSVATDCTYYPSMQANNWYDGKTYADLVGDKFSKPNHALSIRNQFDYYNGIVTENPPSEADVMPPGTPQWYVNYRFLREVHYGPNGTQRNMIAMWYERTHPTPSTTAVIAVHGASSIPDSWFSASIVSQTWGMNYLKFGGDQLLAMGFDVFAPHVIHPARFNVAGARVARSHGEDGYSLDLKRIIALFNHLKGRGYTTIHLVGGSYGAQLVVRAAQALRNDVALGATAAIEGWLPTSDYTDEPNHYALFGWNWENMFPGESMADFMDIPPRTYLAFGTCSRNTSPWAGLTNIYAPTYALWPSDRVVEYDGAHEYNHGAFVSALTRAGYLP